MGARKFPRETIKSKRPGSLDIADFRTSERTQNRYSKFSPSTEVFKNGVKRIISKTFPRGRDDVQLLIRAVVFRKEEEMQGTFLGFSFQHSEDEIDIAFMEAVEGILVGADVGYEENIKVEIIDEAFVYFELENVPNLQT